MNNLHISYEAQNDLAEIKAYIMKELENPGAACATVGKITKSMRILVNYPYAGASLTSITDIDSDYRFLVSGNYLIFYRVCGHDVYVDRVLYGRRDYIRVLFGGTQPNK